MKSILFLFLSLILAIFSTVYYEKILDSNLLIALFISIYIIYFTLLYKYFFPKRDRKDGLLNCLNFEYFMQITLRAIGAVFNFFKAL